MNIFATLSTFFSHMKHLSHLHFFRRRFALSSSLGVHACLALAFAWFATQVNAQTAPNVQVQAKPVAVEAVLTQMLVTVENGKEVLKPVEGVRPGDVIEYRVVYTNRTGQPVRDMQATLPIPIGLEYQARSALPSQNVEAAITGGSYAREPLMRDVGGKKEAIPYSEYRSLRWAIAQISPSGRAEVQARMRVASGTAVSVSPSSPGKPVAR